MHGTHEEVHVTLAGKAVLDARLPLPVSAGSVAYVPAGVQHRFAEMHADLRVPVFIAGSVL